MESTSRYHFLGGFLCAGGMGLLELGALESVLAVWCVLSQRLGEDCRRSSFDDERATSDRGVAYPSRRWWQQRCSALVGSRPGELPACPSPVL